MREGLEPTETTESSQNTTMLGTIDITLFDTPRVRALLDLTRVGPTETNGGNTRDTVQIGVPCTRLRSIVHAPHRRHLNHILQCCLRRRPDVDPSGPFSSPRP
jgi:hypothetical protein